jgi:Polyketide cyclase / dehydrase and lipid transport
MARYRASIDTSREREEMFAYLSDFSTTEEWDPGVVSATRGDVGPARVGSEFHLVARFLGRENELTYRITEYDPPCAVTFRGENATVISEDRITFEPLATGTRITYDADLRLKGPTRAADWFLGLAFKRVGERALAGLTKRLAEGELCMSVRPSCGAAAAQQGQSAA